MILQRITSAINDLHSQIVRHLNDNGAQVIFDESQSLLKACISLETGDVRSQPNLWILRIRVVLQVGWRFSLRV